MSNDQDINWLIRDTNHMIRGPYSRHEVLQLLKRGQIKGKVEVCKAGSYWFALEETNELESFFPEVTDKVEGDFRQEPTATMTSAVGMAESGGGLEETRVISMPHKPTEEAPEPKTALGIASNIVKPVTKQPAEVVVQQEDAESDTAAATGGKKIMWISVALIVLSIGAAFAFYIYKQSAAAPAAVLIKNDSVESPIAALEIQKRLLRGFLLRDQDDLHRAISIFEKSDPAGLAQAVAKGIFKKVFLFDIEGAIGLLEGAKSKSTGKNNVLLVNLLGVFLAERDLSRASTNLSLAVSHGGSLISSYNLAVVELRSNNLEKAEEALRELAKHVKPGDALYSDFATAFAWFADKNGKLGDAILNKAIDSDGVDPRLRLMKGLGALRRNQVTGGEDSFKAFVELLPGLDGSSVDIRKVGDEALYEYAWSSMQELHSLTTGKNANLSPITVAAIGVLTAIQNRNDEAAKILNNALAVSPGNITLLKALAYVRWRSGEFQEVRDLFQNLPANTRDDFSVAYLLAKIDSRLGDSQSAETGLAKLVKRTPQRADVWSSYGDVLLQLKKNDQAQRAFLNALKLDPLDIAAAKGLDQLGDHSYLDQSFYKEVYPIF